MNNWLLLILTLPTENATARMRAWRALKASGSVVLRDGVYLLPARQAHRITLAAIAEDVEASGGATHLLEASSDNYTGLFDRTAEYGQLADDIAACRNNLDRVPAADLARQVRKLRKTFDTVVAIDFFPGHVQLQTAALLDALDDAIRARLSPDEPTARMANIEQLNPSDYSGRVWATRKRPWVDRLASAWLIRRFIDHDARFLWLENPADCPVGALGFDFEGAAFTHVGERVTFETLLASFNLESEPVLASLARIVHYIDIGGLPAPEAAGLEALIDGMRTAIEDDDALLTAAFTAFDFLHTALGKNS
jgi:hypothetical protein